MSVNGLAPVVRFHVAYWWSKWCMRAGIWIGKTMPRRVCYWVLIMALGQASTTVYAHRNIDEITMVEVIKLMGDTPGGQDRRATK